MTESMKTQLNEVIFKNLPQAVGAALQEELTQLSALRNAHAGLEQANHSLKKERDSLRESELKLKEQLAQLDLSVQEIRAKELEQRVLGVRLEERAKAVEAIGAQPMQILTMLLANRQVREKIATDVVAKGESYIQQMYTTNPYGRSEYENVVVPRAESVQTLVNSKTTEEQ